MWSGILVLIGSYYTDKKSRVSDFWRSRFCFVFVFIFLLLFFLFFYLFITVVSLRRQAAWRQNTRGTKYYMLMLHTSE